MPLRSLILATALLATLPDGLAAQDSRPDSAPASRRSLKPGDPFRPETANILASDLVRVVRAQLSLDWFSQQKPPKGQAPKTGTPQVVDLLNLGLQLEQDMRRIEADESMRKLVIENGIPTKDGSYVLPLGRFDWQKPAREKGGAAEEQWLLGVVIAAKLPLGGLKGFDLKGDFLDGKGSIFSVNTHSVEQVRKNGLFVVTVPAKAALSDRRLFEGFEFRLIDLKPRK